MAVTNASRTSVTIDTVHFHFKTFDSETEAVVQEIGQVMWWVQGRMHAPVRRQPTPAATRTLLAAWIGANPWCVLCGASVDSRRARSTSYCDDHDPQITSAGYRAGLRCADAVIEKLEIRDTVPHPDRQRRLRLMWGAIAKRVGVLDWDLMQTEFRQLAPRYRPRTKHAQEIRRLVQVGLAAGNTQSEIAREIGISRQRVHVLVKEHRACKT